MAGIKIVNDQGLVQIDSDFENMLLVGQGSITTKSSWHPFRVSGLTPLPFGLRADEVFITVSGMPSGRRAVLEVLTDSGFSLTGWQSFDSFSSFSLNYHIYARASRVIGALTPNGSHGITVYRADGSKVYDSRLKSLKIRGFITEQFFTNGDMLQSSSFPNIGSLGFTPAVGIYGSGVPHVSSEGSFGGTNAGRGVCVTGSSIDIANVRFMNNAMGYGYRMPFTRTYIVSEV